MARLKTIARSSAVQETLGFLMACYLRLVARTNRLVLDPPDIRERVELPVIGAMWHGQHFMITFAQEPGDKVAALVSRSGDGEMNAIALRHLGIEAIRGSGSRGATVRNKGGAPAMLAMLDVLKRGSTVFMTADLPKVSRRCGLGVVTLAKLSGRPVVPIAVATSRRIDFDTWDRASIGLPFGRGAITIGEPIHVPADADEAGLEGARRAVEAGLDGVHARAYALVGSQDPGGKRSAAGHCNGRAERAA